MLKKFMAAMMLSILLAVFFAGCGGGVKTISQEEAMQMMQSETDYVILDVRTEPEYEKKHIANAKFFPVGELRNGVMPTELVHDKAQIVFVYCWAGRRAEEASNILAENGYINVYNIGGLASWSGSVAGEEVE